MQFKPKAMPKAVEEAKKKALKAAEKDRAARAKAAAAAEKKKPAAKPAKAAEPAPEAKLPVPVVQKALAGLPAMIDTAARQLASATSAAEVLEAKHNADAAYSTSKAAARLAKAKAAGDIVVAAAHRAQADALDISSAAQARLAAEYDAAAERGEVSQPKDNLRRGPVVPNEDIGKITLSELGIDRRDIAEGRDLAAVIAQDPDAIQKALANIMANGDEPTRAKLKKALAPTIKTFRGEEQDEKKQVRNAREKRLGQRIKAMPDEEFGVIYADPAWKFVPRSLETGMDRAADNHYPTMELEDIKASDVGRIAAMDCVLLLWTTNDQLAHGIDTLRAWGFKYVSNYVWVKPHISTGYWNRSRHEILLIGTKGNPVPPAMGTQWDSVFEQPAGEHSAKPEKVLEMIEEYWPNTPKIELNRRGKARPGWAAHGLEVEE